MTFETIKRHIISLVLTFVASFFLVVGFEMADPAFVFSTMSLKIVALSGLIAGARAVAKIVYEISYNFLSPKK